MENRADYISNKEMLAEIARSKITYCSFLDADAHARCDVIVTHRSLITPEIIEVARKNRATFMSTKEAPVDMAEVPTSMLVFRVMTEEHIPHDPLRKRRGKDGGPTKTNFPAFKHFVLDGTNLVEVGRSHWIGSFANGHFSTTHGEISKKLARMLMRLVERYARRGNWRNYTYNDEMRGYALLQLSAIALQFDESRSENPFAFFTTSIRNCFTRVLNLEKRNQHIRDDLLIIAGAQPSFTRQVEHEMEMREADQKERAAKNQKKAPAAE